MTNGAGTTWLHRVRERGVIRVAASYAVIAWLLLQIADVTFEPLGVPRWVMVSLIVAAVLGDRAEDAREIGRQLGARYLLEGSVQSDRTRMRVMTQLIDTETGADVWSMRFDRRPGDIFEIQDEIAMQVTEALELSLDARARDRLTGQGTDNVEAYLAFMQGRHLLANGRVVDAKQAIGQFERAIKLDPKFAAGYVSLAEVELFVAEYDVTDDRQERFERAKIRGRELVEQALALDADNGDAYLGRAHIEYFEDLAAAEADYRRGLELSPNALNGYTGLATVLYQIPSRRDEAFAMLERARKLDPLEPSYDVFKSVFLFYERADIRGANELLVDVVRDHPRNVPALTRLCELRSFAMDELADGVLYCEQALAIDPLSAETRLHLIRDYLDLDDVSAATAVAEEARGNSVVPRVLLQMHARDWAAAGEGAYESVARRIATPTVMGYMLNAIRMHARVTGDTRRARIAIEQVAGVTWDATGKPSWPDGSEGLMFAVMLADALIIDGEQERGRRLLADAIARANDEIRNQRRPEYWYLGNLALALALNGDREGSLALLQRYARTGGSEFLHTWRYGYEVEPGFAALRRDPRFQDLARKAQEHSVAERRAVDRLRREGLVPERGGGERPADDSPVTG